MKILLDHTADHTNFLLHTVWSLSWFMMTLQKKESLKETDLPEFYIYNDIHFNKNGYEISKKK